MDFKITMLKMFTFLLVVTVICVFLEEHSSIKFLPVEELSCSCGKCVSENDTWFIRRFNQSMEPFMSARHELSEADFNWWKHLQRENRNFTAYKETVDSVFQIFPPNPDLLEPRPEKCRTCAVVGNSVNLIGSGYGPLIDLHDVIIRINHGRTKGFEADVGNRTTHRIMYPESSEAIDNTTYLVLFPFKIKDIEWLVRAFTSKFPGTAFKISSTGCRLQTSYYEWYHQLTASGERCNKYGSLKSMVKANRDLVTVLNPAFMKYVHQEWLENKGKYPSTGFMAVILTLHICGEVNVFGYGADKDGNWSHYWEKLKNKSLKTGPHPGTYEYETIQKLFDNHKISFYSGR